MAAESRRITGHLETGLEAKVEPELYFEQLETPDMDQTPVAGVM